MWDMAENFDKHNLQTLLDLLADTTENYTKLLVNSGSPDELEQNKTLMNQLLFEIKKRRQENPGE